MNYLNGSFAIPVGSKEYRESDLWQTCPICQRSCMGVDGLKAHITEKHPVQPEAKP